MANPLDDNGYVRKRRVPRRVLERKMGVLAHGHYAISSSHEIGEGGMLISTELSLDEGQRIVVTFTIPGFVEVIVRGIVRYGKINPQTGLKNYGIQYETLGFQERRKIRSYVAQKSHLELSAEV